MWSFLILRQAVCIVVCVLLGISPASEVQMPGKFPKEHRLHSKHGESLKTTSMYSNHYALNG